MLSPTEGLSLFGGDTWLSCHTDVLSADFILTIRCCKWQPTYPFKCIFHKTYFLKQKPSDPPSRNKISKQPSTHILHCSQSSLWGRHGVLHLKQRHMKRCRARIRKKKKITLFDFLNSIFRSQWYWFVQDVDITSTIRGTMRNWNRIFGERGKRMQLSDKKVSMILPTYPAKIRKTSLPHKEINSFWNC